MFKFKMAFFGCLLSLPAIAQINVRGIVRDTKNEPLEGATIELVKQGIVAITDSGGNFLFTNLKGETFLGEVRFVGFQAKRLTLSANESNLILLKESVIVTDEILVTATRAADNSPTTFSNISKASTEKQNFGQDLPFILNWSPSIVTTSDAGAGVGYTGLRIRGSDATRINVTINGIPLNDSESQGVFWVNTPDLASSTQSIQVQRGVGTSTNGAAAFGASVNIQTNVRNEKSYADIINSVGSFDTWRHTVAFGSGFINDRFVFDGRLSQITSNGFIDRGSSDLKSYYLSGGYYGKKTLVKAIVFGGREITYQSWYGVPESRLKNDVAGMLETAATEGWNANQTQNLLTSNSRTFNLYAYPNQVDNYRQDHYQLHFSHQINSAFTANSALHYTRGSGYYEEFRIDENYSRYGLGDITVGSETFSSSDLVRRRWLDNHFYGITWSLNYEKSNLNSVLGGGWNKYDGNHFGEIIWSALPMGVAKDYRYYFNNGEKSDFNIFWKTNYSFTEKLSAFLDLQYRRIDYRAGGRENRQFDFNIDTKFDFFNPKVGLTYSLGSRQNFYASYAIANREPVRNDFVDGAATRTPVAERMGNLEIGWRKKTDHYAFNVNYYLMNYTNQLVLTGALNDVGASLRTNVPDSYRMGIELDGTIQLSKRLRWNANLTLSRNKIKKFTEVLNDYGINFDEFNEVTNVYVDTDVSFSPSVIAGSVFSVIPAKGIEVSWLSKYVGQQFLDNTSNSKRQIDSYFVNDLRINYSLKPRFMRELSVGVLINNLLDESYESNGFTYGHFAGLSNIYRQNFYYPQAGRNYMLMVALRF
ncbi:MAG: TonB-dependent receptor [Cyclobacteriaceae bacterium]|nr:TonB-dependent receptor [Cyclobacteriaceae bacterium]